MKLVELDLSKVEFSSNDTKLGIRIPKILSRDLAYETGTHIGDGHISCYKRKDGNLYLSVYSGDFRDEFDFYQNVLIPLLYELYNKKLLPYKSTKNTIQLIIKSKAITTFKINSLGLANGCKNGIIKIPKIIMDSDLEFKKSCLGGIIDTDFSLVFRHGKYPKITGSVMSENKKLKNQVLEILEDLNIKYTCCYYKHFDKRFNKNYSELKIDINGRKNLEKWIKEIGFRSPKHLVKLKLWEKFGFCKQFLSYDNRKQILENATLAQLVER